jgi:hypothetical protein
MAGLGQLVKLFHKLVDAMLRAKEQLLGARQDESTETLRHVYLYSVARMLDDLQ